MESASSNRHDPATALRTGNTAAVVLRDSHQRQRPTQREQSAEPEGAGKPLHRIRHGNPRTAPRTVSPDATHCAGASNPRNQVCPVLARSGATQRRVPLIPGRSRPVGGYRDRVLRAGSVQRHARLLHRFPAAHAIGEFDHAAEDDFGVCLTPSNVDQQNLKLRHDHERYQIEAPDAAAKIAELMRKQQPEKQRKPGPTNAVE